MAEMPDSSVHRITCDPPYFLSFMNRAWDSAAVVQDVQDYGDLGMLPGYGRGGLPSDRSRVLNREAVAAYQTHLAWLRQAFRVLVPGGSIQAFSGTRTVHRLAAAMEDVGFEIVPFEAWIYASGFPKSLNVAKAIDKKLGAVRETKRIPYSGDALMRHGGENTRPWIEEALVKGYHEAPGDESATEQAAVWNGWGTALKPAWEPIIVGRKPNP